MNDNPNWPVIFYVPHPDDDAIGFAAGIAEHLEANRPIYVVLLASGHNDDLLKMMNGDVDCPLFGRKGWENHPKRHHFNMSPNDINLFRIEEFERSLAVFGIPRDNIFEICIQDAEYWNNYNQTVITVKSYIKYMANRYPNASHKLVSGLRDRYNGLNPTHRAFYEAAVQFHNENPEIKDFRFYRVYRYWDLRNIRYSHTDFVFENKDTWQEKKHAALDCYKRYDPAATCYALGYHSVYDLIDNAYASPKTYLDLLPNEFNLFEEPITLETHLGMYLQYDSDNLIYSNGDWPTGKQEFLANLVNTEEDVDQIVLIAIGAPNRKNYLYEENGDIKIGGIMTFFNLYRLGTNKIALVAPNKKYLRASIKATEKLVADSSSVNIWEAFSYAGKFMNCKISAVSMGGFGLLYVFARAANDNLIYCVSDGQDWNGWFELDKNIDSEPKAVVIDDLIYVFIKNIEGKLKLWELTGHEVLGSFILNFEITSDPQVVLDTQNHIHIFARGPKPYCYTQHIFLDEIWKSENIDENLGFYRITTDIKTMQSVSEGELKIFFKLKGVPDWHSWYSMILTNGLWSKPIPFLGSEADPEFASPPEIVSFRGTEFAFVRGTDNYLWISRVHENAPFDWQQSNWQICSSPKIITMDNSLIFVAAQDAVTFKLECKYWDGEEWSSTGYSNRCDISSDPELVLHKGYIHLFVRGEDNNVMENQIQSGLHHAIWYAGNLDYQNLGGQVV